jgi:hypothetical protein
MGTFLLLLVLASIGKSAANPVPQHAWDYQ